MIGQRLIGHATSNKQKFWNYLKPICMYAYYISIHTGIFCLSLYLVSVTTHCSHYVDNQNISHFKQASANLNTFLHQLHVLLSQSRASLKLF